MMREDRGSIPRGANSVFHFSFNILSFGICDFLDDPIEKIDEIASEPNIFYSKHRFRGRTSNTFVEWTTMNRVKGEIGDLPMNCCRGQR